MSPSPAALAWAVWACLGAVLVALAFALRIAVHAGFRPGGVDSWYLLAYARELRRRPGVTTELPQYLLQDRRQSYPPLFPWLLSLVPTPALERWFWVISPAVDCVHLLLLYWLTWRITDSVAIACITGAIYAFTPHLISETRSLSARSFAALMHTAAMLLVLRAVLLDASWPWLPLAVAAGAGVFLSSATAAAGYSLACLTLSVVFAEPAYVLTVLAAFVAAWIASAGHLADVLRNYWHAVEFWRRNRGRYGAHPVGDSPVYGTPRPRTAARPGFLGRTPVHQVLRVIGENPFVIALPFAPVAAPPWGLGLYGWAVSVSAMTILATLLPPLRLFGAGRSYIKTAAFPVAYTLALGIGSTARITSSFGLLVVACLAAGALAIAFFVVYTRRRATERTESTPDGLERAAQHLRTLPEGGVFCLPYMYADYVAYNADKPVLWGAHCGNLEAIEEILPVIRRPLEELASGYGLRYVLLDRLYASPRQIGLDHARRLGTWSTFELYELDEMAVRMVAS